MTAEDLLRIAADFMRREAGRPWQASSSREAFVDLQAARIRADDDPRPSFTRADASLSVDLAGEAIVLRRALPDDAKRLLVVQLISKQR